MNGHCPWLIRTLCFILHWTALRCGIIDCKVSRWPGIIHHTQKKALCVRPIGVHMVGCLNISVLFIAIATAQISSRPRGEMRACKANLIYQRVVLYTQVLFQLQSISQKALCRSVERTSSMVVYGTERTRKQLSMRGRTL